MFRRGLALAALALLCVGAILPSGPATSYWQSRQQVAVAGGGAWTPASVTTAFWYKSDDTGTLTCTGGCTNGNEVTAWADKSGNARTLSKVSTNGPDYNTGILNSKACVHFDYTEPNAMTTASFTLAQPFLIMTVIKTKSNPQVRNFGILVDDVAGTGNRPVMLFNVFSASDQPGIFAGTATRTVGVSLSANTGYMYYGGFNGASSVTKVSGTAEQSGTDIGSNGFTTGFLLASTGADPATTLDAYVCEIFAIPSYSGTDLTNAIAYVQSEWGVAP